MICFKLKAWNTLIWFGGILGLSSALTKGKFFEWLQYLEAHELWFRSIHDAYPHLRYFRWFVTSSHLVLHTFCNASSILDRWC